MMLKLLKRGYYEILKLLETKKRMPSEIAKILTQEGMSERTVYSRLGDLKELGLIEESHGVNISTNRPVKYYLLTDYGKAILEKLEELETLLQDIARTPDKPIEEVEKEVMEGKHKPVSETEERVKLL